VAFANILRGVPLGADHQWAGSFFDLLNPYALLGGVTSFLLFTLHGGVFLTLRTDADLQERARRVARLLALPTTAVVLGFLTWTFFNARDYDGIVPGVVPIGALVAVAAVEWLLREKLDGWAFLATGLAIVLITATIFLNLYPRVMVSSISATNDLTIWNASSTHYTLTIMTWVAFIFMPLVLAYQGWTYWVFRKRIRRADAEEAPGTRGETPSPA
jgi:cytochrome d ubiquinol oxidase subunit II